MISIKFLIRGVSAESTGVFRKNCFPTTFGGHLEFLRKSSPNPGQDIRAQFHKGLLNIEDSMLLKLLARS